MQQNASKTALLSHGETPERSAAAAPSAGTFRIVRGKHAIAALQPLLAELAWRCGQAGETDSLSYFLNAPDARTKHPCLVLLGALHHTVLPRTAALRSGDLRAAVLLFEYLGPARVGARVFATTDGSGRRNVLAPAGERARTAAMAATILINRGAHVVQIGFNEDHLDNGAAARTPPPRLHGSRREAVSTAIAESPPRPRGCWTLLEREIPMYLPLLETFDATLARMSQKTRFNLRYYRRRAEADLGCTFVPDAQVDWITFRDFSRIMFWPVSDVVSRGRYGVLNSSATSFLCGTRDRNGRWLSLVRGRRQAGMVEIDWLMNRADLRQYSLSTVVRSYLIQHEISLGSKRLYIEGGTAMPIRRSFLKGPLSELTLKRDSAYVRLLEKAAAKVFRNHYLANTLRSPDLDWTRW